MRDNPFTSSPFDLQVISGPSVIAGRLTRRELLIAIGGTAASLALVGCGGGGGGAAVGPFTVSPARAIPGNVVTLTGLQLHAGATPTITFGGQDAIIHQHTSAGLEVLVPVFLTPGTYTVAQPSAPVTVSVQLNAAPVQAGNTFTVDALPPAPGTTAVMTQDLADMAGFFQDFLQKGLFTLLADDAGGTSPLDRAGAIQCAACAGALADVYVGKDNPNSFLKVISGTSAVAPGATFPLDVLDAVLAQGPAGSLMSDFAQAMHDAISAAAPDAVTLRSAHRGEGPVSRGGNPPFKFNSFGVDWSKVSKAQAIIVTLQVQAFLAAAVNSNAATFLSMAYTIGMSAVKIIVGVTQPELLPLVEATDIVTTVGITMLAAISTTMPGAISDFYVAVNGTQRRTGDPAINITVSLATPLKTMLVTQSTGGLSFTAAGLASLALTVLEAKVPGVAKVVQPIKASSGPRGQTRATTSPLVPRRLSQAYHGLVTRPGHSKRWWEL